MGWLNPLLSQNLAGDRVANYKTKHGHARKGKWSDTYKSWKNIRSRLAAKKGNSYKNYVLKGIAMFERWDKFENFLADMGERPFKNFSIDRINNARGYEPGNCRWASRSVQNHNRRWVKGSSRYKGVHYEPPRNKWVAQCKGKKLGRFDNQEDAAKAYNDAAISIFGEFAVLNMID